MRSTCAQATRRLALLTAVAVAGLTLFGFSACGDDDEGADSTTTAPAETSTASPCDLLEPDAIALRLGEGVEGVEQSAEPPDNEGPVTECVWETADEPGIDEKIVVTVGSAADYEKFAGLGFEESSTTTIPGEGTSSEQSESSSEPIEGLGEEAVLLEGTYGILSTSTEGYTVVVRSGDSTLSVGWSAEDSSPEGVEALASEALEAL